MRPLFLAATAMGFLSICACSTEDPDLNPKPTLPSSSSNQKAWNQPIPGQGGGALGALPDRPRR